MLYNQIVQYTKKDFIRMQENTCENFIENTKLSLIKAQLYCNVIKEILTFLDTEPFSNDILFSTLENDIQKFLSKQEKKLDKLGKVNCNDN